ncbi:hypothetical protein, partial [uncultured Allobaculum sp.]
HSSRNRVSLKKRASSGTEICRYELAEGAVSKRIGETNVSKQMGRRERAKRKAAYGKQNTESRKNPLFKS